MKAFVTSVGEKTTDICVSQLRKHGFDVILLDKKEPWIEKYKDFIRRAAALKEDVLRIDADIIPTASIAKVPSIAGVFHSAYMIQFQVFDFYKFDIHMGMPIIYKKAGLSEMVKVLDHIKTGRPETEMSRLPIINDWMVSCPVVMGAHGFFQDKETMDRAFDNKLQRGQLGQYDFSLAADIIDLQK